MAVTEALEIYLKGHLAGAAAGGQAAQRIASDDKGIGIGNFLSDLHREIEEDTDVLRDIMARLEVTPATFQEALAMGAERVSQMVVEAQSSGDSPVTILVQMETLSMGIEGKILLWRALKKVASSHPPLAEIDFDDLIKRAQLQREELEQHRLEAAQLALS